MKELPREQNVLEQAIRNEQWDEVVRLASPELVNTYNEDGVTPLMLAAWRAPEEVLIKIIENASEECVKHKDGFGRTILHRLSWFSRSSALRRALEVNSDVNAQDDFSRRTPLHACLSDDDGSFEEHRETAKILMQYGGMPTIKDKYGRTPIDDYKGNPCNKYDKNLKDEQKKELLKILEGKAGELSQNPIERLKEKEIGPERIKPEDEQRLRSLLTELNKHYRGSDCRLLRCLLFNHLPIQILATDGNTGLALFNELERRGHISSSNVIILSEVAKLTNIESAISCIADYNAVNHCDTEGTVLTKYRKKLFCALTQVASDELPVLIHYYKLRPYRDTFRDVWDVVYYLEKEKLLDDTPDKVKRFAGLLNGRARDVLLDALTSPTTKKATEGVTNVTKGVTTNEVSDSLDVTEGVTKKEVTDSSTGVTGGVASKDVTAKTEVTCKMTPEKQSGTKRRKRNRNRNRNGQTENTPKEEEITTVCPNKYLMIFLAFCLLAIVLLAIVGLVQ